MLRKRIVIFLTVTCIAHLQSWQCNNQLAAKEGNCNLHVPQQRSSRASVAADCQICACKPDIRKNAPELHAATKCMQCMMLLPCLSP